MCFISNSYGKFTVNTPQYSTSTWTLVQDGQYTLSQVRYSVIILLVVTQTHHSGQHVVESEQMVHADAYIYRSLRTSSYGSIQLQFDISAYDLEPGDTCTVYYAYDSPLEKTLLQSYDPPSGDVEFWGNQTFNLPNSDSVNTLWIWFEVTLVDSGYDYCYVNNLYIKATSKPTISPSKDPSKSPLSFTVSPTGIPTVLTTEMPTFAETDEPTTPEDNWILYTLIAVGIILVIATLFGGLYAWKSRKNNVHTGDSMKVEMEIQQNIARVVNDEETLEGDDWEHWNNRDVVAWISSVQNGKYKAYASAFVVQNIVGIDLGSIEKSDLMDFGIKAFRDRAEIFNHIQNLLSNKHDEREGIPKFNQIFNSEGNIDRQRFNSKGLYSNKNKQRTTKTARTTKGTKATQSQSPTKGTKTALQKEPKQRTTKGTKTARTTKFNQIFNSEGNIDRPRFNSEGLYSNKNKQRTTQGTKATQSQSQSPDFV
eukprot:578004_1